MPHLKSALHESIIDTSIGFLYNVPLNYIMLLIGMHYDLGALTLTVIMTAVFTLTAIIRKVIVRLHFHKKQTKKLV